MQTNAEDPRSVFYKRTLVRPKIPVWQLLLILLATAGGIVAVCLGAASMGAPLWLRVLCGLVAAILVLRLLAKPLLIALVKTYQALAPKAVRERCRYEPSCSVYMIQAVEKYGFRKGFRKGMKRWNGCKPPNGGIDLP